MVCFPTYGGSGVVASELGKYLVKKGYEVHFISTALPFRLPAYQPNLYYHEVQTLDYPLFEHPHYALSLTSRVVDVVRSHQLEMLHVHYALPHATVAYLAREILFQQDGIYLPVVTTLHGTDITLVGRDQSFLPVVRFSIDASDAVTAVSEYLRKETVEHFSPRRFVHVIYNFVDLAAMRQKETSAGASDLCLPSERLLLHISNMRPVKRLLDVIEIFKRVKKQCKSRLLVVGDGPDRTAAEALVERYGLGASVQFLGKLGKVKDILWRSDLLLLPSEHESFGLVALEAMAAATPVLASDAGGVPELVESGKSGYVCPVGDVDAMADRACEMLSKDRLSAFKTAAQQRAAVFDAPGIVKQYEQLYARVSAEASKVSASFSKR